MNRIVYLYELDSVKNTEEEILYGQRAAFTEIVENGNRIVLSFNQLTDSLAFLAAVKNQKSYPHIMTLFEKGVLKVSRYGNMRTASQYIQQSIERCLQKNDNSFIFSGLPISCNDKILLEKLDCALKYSDLSVLEDFIEEVENKKKDSEPKERKKLQEKLENLEYILRYTKMILMLSVEKISSNPPKKTPSRSFPEFINIVLEYLPEISFTNTEIKENIAGAIEKLQNIQEYFQRTDSKGILQTQRSNWIHRLEKCDESLQCHLAELILHLCYNYTVEDSISNISKRYDDMDFQKTFCIDLKSRLEEYWTRSQNTLHHTETNLINFKGKLPNWSAAVRVSKYSDENIKQEKFYPINSAKERRCWFWHVFKNYIKMSFIMFMYIGIICVVDMGISQLQDMNIDILADIFSSKWGIITLNTIIFGIISSIISLVSKLPDILECIQNILIGIKDLLIMILKKLFKARENRI